MQEGTNSSYEGTKRAIPSESPEGGGGGLNGTDRAVMARTQTTTVRKLKQLSLIEEGFGVRCYYGKVCKNTRGLKIHQRRSWCGTSATQEQLSGETKENFSQEAPHSAEDLFALELPQHQIPGQPSSSSATPIYSSRRERIKWPKLSDSIAWMQFDDDLDSILEAALAGPVHKKVDSLTTIAYNFA